MSCVRYAGTSQSGDEDKGQVTNCVFFCAMKASSNSSYCFEVLFQTSFEEEERPQQQVGVIYLLYKVSLYDLFLFILAYREAMRLLKCYTGKIRTYEFKCFVLCGDQNGIKIGYMVDLVA